MKFTQKIPGRAYNSVCHKYEKKNAINNMFAIKLAFSVSFIFKIVMSRLPQNIIHSTPNSTIFRDLLGG